MIKWRLIQVMADKDISNEKLAEMLGKDITAIARLRQNPPKRMDMDLLDKLCSSLNCETGDLILHVKETVNED